MKLLTTVLGLTLFLVSFSGVPAHAEPTEKLNQRELLKMVNEKSTFNFGSSYRSWARSASDALSRLERAPSLDQEAKAILMIFLRGSERPWNENEFPFYQGQDWATTLKNLTDYMGSETRLGAIGHEIMRDGQYVYPVVPVAQVLAKHGVNEAVPVLASLYFNTESWWLKNDYFFALTKFNDARAIPVFQDWWQRNNDRLETDEDIAIFDIIPTVREYLESKNPQGGALKVSEDQADLIADRASKLMEAFSASSSLGIEQALNGPVTRRNPKKASISVFGPNKRWMVKQLPFDADLQEQTEASFTRVAGEIGDLNKGLATANDLIDETNIRVDQTNGRIDETQRNLARTQADLVKAQGAIAGLQTRTNELGQNIEKLDKKVDANQAAVEAEMNALKSDLESFRNFVGEELKKSDGAHSEKVAALQKQITALQKSIEALEAQLDPRRKSLSEIFN